ncbi:hypothetical protein [Methanolobus sp.]|uniref:hypothetical protein n=1 Tax=Methanolobus sp. TaxID=1874737 RepID=UPI0025D99CEC|nr:hypothetical protein [Methanolobus sp.]
MNSMGYIQSGGSSSDADLQSLREHPTIRDFASMPEDIYRLVTATNPTLKLFVDLAKEICAGGVEE